ncbi:hypothetical protein ACJX0J_015462, partial [Zea mays]
KIHELYAKTYLVYWVKMVENVFLSGAIFHHPTQHINAGNMDNRVIGHVKIFIAIISSLIIHCYRYSRMGDNHLKIHQHKALENVNMGTTCQQVTLCSQVPRSRHT